MTTSHNGTEDETTESARQRGGATGSARVDVLTPTLALLLFAFSICVTVYWIKEWVNWTQVFQTMVTTKATVIHQHIEEREWANSEGDTVTNSYYYLTYRFRPEEGGDAISREEEVPEYLYTRQPVDSQMTIHYPPGSPSEASWRGLYDKGSEIWFVVFLDVIALIAVYVAFIRPIREARRTRKR